MVTWLGGLILGTWLFHALGSGPLAAPPFDPAGWSAWLADRDALTASVAVLRLLVLALSWYLVGATTIGIVARLARAARLVGLADTLTVPFVRRLLQATLGVSLATAMVASAMPTGSVPSAADDVSVALSTLPLDGPTADERPDDAIELRAVAAEQENGVTLERVRPTDRPVPLERLERARAQARGATEAADVGSNVDGDTSEVVDDRAEGYVVVAGDSLWSIAAAAVAGGQDQAPDDELVAAYWRTVIDTNRDALTDPENPDLIFPGQIVHLPELPA